MTKYTELIGLIPMLIIVTLVVDTHIDVEKRIKHGCVTCVMYLLLFLLLYVLLLHVKLNKYVAIGIILFLWIVIFFIRRKFML